MNTLLRILVLALVLTGAVHAQGNLEINTPAIAQLKNTMQSRHGQLAPFYASGAVGIARDGTIQIRDANLIPLPQRAAANNLVAQENGDRAALYREIAKANGNPGWESEIRSTFGARWIDRAQPGWFVESASGAWVKK